MWQSASPHVTPALQPAYQAHFLDPRTMLNIYLRTPFYLLAGCSLLSCSSGLLSSRIDEGVIEYALTFPGYDPNGIMAGMLPERTTLTFSEGKQLAELSAGMGVFRTSMVADNSQHSLQYHMSLMSKKIVSELMTRDLEAIHKGISKPYILHTADVDTIAGYPCKRAVAIFDRMDLPEVDLWYTEAIDMDDPNWFGPFAEVPGVLMRYEMVQYGLRMHLDAISVTPGKVDGTQFDTRAEYERVAPEVLHHEMTEVLGTFSM
jgi:hypothetical protein